MRMGATYRKDGQGYRLVGLRDYVNRFGHESKLVILRTHCADCGAPFEFMTTQGRFKQRAINRRCGLHKRPGTPVRGWRAPTPSKALNFR